MYTKKYKIAVIIPVYNAEKYIKKCIKSFQKQTFQNFKLVLVNDGSKDKSGKICDDMAKKDERIYVIHQENKGAVEARKTGVLSQEAQKADYIFLSDADDVVESDALEKLYNTAVEYDADCVCANMRKYWKGIKVNSKYKSPCFNIKAPKVYNNRDIIEKIYISCFGITDYPVNLAAKLYKSALITKAIDFPAIVRFMGEDLSVTLRCLPLTQRLVIIPDIVYNYRIGGGTSRFMPDMLNDFLALYDNKVKLIYEYDMPQDAMFYINIELMNIVISWLKMCKKQGKYLEIQMKEEIKRVCEIKEVSHAAMQLCERENKNQIALMVYNQEIEEIYTRLMQQIDAQKRVDKIKEILKKI